MVFQNEKDIQAPIEKVWDVTRDVESWPKWTPTVDEMTRLDQGPFTVGSTVRIKQPGMQAAEWKVTELREGKGFTWETSVLGMQMAATHDLVPIESGARSTLRLEVSGILATLLWPLISTSANKNLELENAGLKKHCEGP